MVSVPALRLPNDCLIVALQAAFRLRDVVSWVAVISVESDDLLNDHVLTVFEAPPGVFWAYDANGSRELKVSTRRPDPIGRAICRTYRWKFKKAMEVLSYRSEV